MFTPIIYSETAAPGEGTSGCLKMVVHLIEVLFSMVMTIMSAGSIGSWPPNGEPQALATEIWGKICPPSDQEAIV